MYTLILLKDGCRKELDKIDSLRLFRKRFPRIEYHLVGYVIYIHQEVLVIKSK